MALLAAFVLMGSLASRADRSAPEEVTMNQPGQQMSPGHGPDAFFMDEDRQRIREAAATEWGAAIVTNLEQAVQSRRSHDLSVPREPAGHSHKYFCPMHNVRLRFDWDRPTEHFCAACGDYLRAPQYDPAWRGTVSDHNRDYLEACAYLWAATGEPEYLQQVRAMLLDYAEKYPGYPLHGREMEPDAAYGGRLFAQSLDEAVWITGVTPAYLEAAGGLAPAERQKIEQDLLRPCVEVLLRNRTGGNWQVWHNAGLMSLGVALNDRELIQIAIDDPQHGFHAMLREGVTDDGWWNEGSPTYHFFPLAAMLATAEAARLKGINLWNEELRRLLDAPLLAAYADMTLPAHNDGWHGVSLRAQAGLYELADARFGGSPYRSLLGRIYGAGTRRDDARALLNASDIEPTTATWGLSSANFPDTGFAVLRSGPRMAVLKYGPVGGWHGHPDKLSLALHDGREEVLPDLGTCAYGVPAYGDWYRRTVAHNTVVVDGRDQDCTSGTLISFEQTEAGGRVEAECATAYPGVTMRRTLVLDGKTMTDRFTCVSAEDHTCDYVLLLPQPVAVPEGAQAADPGEAEAYGQIRDARTWPVDRAFELKVNDGTLRLECSVASVAIAGEAPGVAGRMLPDNSPHKVYPLILRSRSPEMEVRAEWRWPD